jgi:hypothetical protein
VATKDISDKQVCEAYVEYHEKLKGRTSFIEGEFEWPYNILQRVTGQPEKVCYRAMERASDRGYIEYGVSLRTGWLTDKGKALLSV